MAILHFHSRSAKGPDSEFTTTAMQNTSRPLPISVASHLLFQSQAAHSAWPSPLSTGAQLVLLTLPNSRDAGRSGSKSHSSCQGWHVALREIAPCGRCREKWPKHSSFSHSQGGDRSQHVMFIYQLTGELNPGADVLRPQRRHTGLLPHPFVAQGEAESQ